MGTEARPTVSVVVACLDAAQTLPRLLTSLARQRCRDFELVVIDGGSTDGSLALFEELGDAVGTLVSEPDEGIYHAWNKGVRLGRGRYFLFLGADDYLWDDTVLQKMLPQLSGPGGPRQLVYGSVAMVDERGQELGRVGRPWREAAREAHRSMPLPFPACFIAAELFERFGGFDPDYAIAGDFEWVLRALPEVTPHFVAGVVVTGMGAGGVSSVPANEWRRFAEDLRALRRHGYLSRPLALLRFRLRGWLRLAVAAGLGPTAARHLANRVRSVRGRPPLPKVPR